MEGWREKAIREAVEDFRKIKEIFSELKGISEPKEEKFEKSFRARARELPSSISVSLLPPLAFCYSQVEGKWEEILGLLEGKKAKIDESPLAYGLYLYFALKHLFGSQKARDPLACFLEITERKPASLAFLKTRLLVYLLEMKRLAEAEFRAT
ncbi:MAG: type III-B CRISPR module-associated protein Cmr5 [Candidatus Hadarchaeales archaeon]